MTDPYRGYRNDRRASIVRAKQIPLTEMKEHVQFTCEHAVRLRCEFRSLMHPAVTHRVSRPNYVKDTMYHPSIPIQGDELVFFAVRINIL